MFTINHFPVKRGTAEQVEQFGQLIKDGHKDVLVAFGQDCASHGYERGLRDSLIVVGIGAAVVTAVGLFKGYLRKRKLNKTIKEFNEYMEAEIDIRIE